MLPVLSTTVVVQCGVRLGGLGVTQSQARPGPGSATDSARATQAGTASAALALSGSASLALPVAVAGWQPQDASATRDWHSGWHCLAVSQPG